MQNQILHPTTSPDRNLSKNTGRYVENTNKKSSFFYDKYVNSTIMVDSFYWNSIGSWIPTHKNLLLARFLIRPILDTKFPLMLTSTHVEIPDPAWYTHYVGHSTMCLMWSSRSCDKKVPHLSRAHEFTELGIQLMFPLEEIWGLKWAL